MVDSLRAQLQRDEGLRLRLYKDTKSKWTIGYGRNLDDVGVSLAEAEFMLDNDITKHAAAVLSLLPWTTHLDEVRREVLINMSFMGPNKLLTFTKMLAALRRGDWDVAAAELLDSDYHVDVGPRAERLAKQLVTGERQ